MRWSWADAMEVSTDNGGRERELFLSFRSRIDHSDPGAHNSLGVFFFRKGLFAEALQQFELALELDPGMVVAENNLRCTSRKLGAYDERVTAAREGLRKAPGDADLRRELALTYYRSGQFRGAVREAEILLGQAPRDLPTLMLLARSHAKLGEPARQVETLRRASGLDPDSVVVDLALARALYNQGTWEGARSLLQRAIDRYPESPEARYLMAFVLGDLGRADEADTHARRALQLNPLLARQEANLALDDDTAGSPALLEPPSPADAGRARLQLAMAYAQKGYHDEAIARFQAEVDVNEADALRGVTETLILAGDFQAALRHLGVLTRQHRADSSLLNELGACLYQLGEVNEARRAFREALRYNPGATDVLNNIAVTMTHYGNHDGACEMLRKALRLAPRAETAALNLALIEAKQGRVEESFRIYRDVLGRNPRNVEAWIGIGLLLTGIGRSVDARNAFLKAVEANPRHAGAHYNLSFALSQLGEYTGALTAVSQAQALSPYYTPSTYRLVLALALGGFELPLEPVIGSSDLGRRIGFEVEQSTIDAIFAELGRTEPDAEETSDPLALARDYANKGLLEQAHSEVSRAIVRGADTAEAHALAGDILTRRGLYGEALDRYRDALVRDPADIEVRIGEARSLIAMKEFPAALEKAEALLNEGRRDEHTLLLAAEARAGVGDVAGAYRALERVRGLAKDAVPVERLEGVIARDAGDLVRAGIAFQAVVRNDPDDVDGWELLGEVQDKRGDYVEAEKCFKKVLELSHGHGGAAIALARLYRERGEFNAAVNVLVDLLITQPSDMEALLALGQSLLDAGRDEAAIGAFRRVLARDSRSVAARYLSGVALARLHDYNSAVTEWQFVVEMQPDSEIGREARKHIERAREIISPTESEAR